MAGRLEGKICIITGCGSDRGLGAATARRFAEEGAVIYVTDLESEGAESIAKAINANGGTAFAVQQDVTSQADWNALFARVEAEQGQLDVIVNNAGIAVLKMLHDLTAEDWTRQLKVNLDSVFYGTQGAVELMRKTGKGGSIVNLSSIGGQVGVPACGAYGAAKGGVRLFSKTVALECAAENIRCNSVHPGMIDTAMQDVARRDNPEVFKEMIAAIPMQRMGDPVDVANLVLFLASDEAGYITGSEFTVDGGVTAM